MKHRQTYRTSHARYAAPLLLLLAFSIAVPAQTDFTGAAQQGPSVSGDDGAPLPNDPQQSHSNRDASGEITALARLHPEQLIGKTLALSTGEAVGKIFNVRRKLDNLYLYLIVDATPYFNEPTEYAVAVRDVDSIRGEIVFIDERQGMHLRGQTYYADDYTAAEDNFPDASLEQE